MFYFIVLILILVFSFVFTRILKLAQENPNRCIFLNKKMSFCFNPFFTLIHYNKQKIQRSTLNNFQYTLNRLIKTGITLFLLYLIFTNFFAFIGVLALLAVLFYFFVFKKLKKMSNGFQFQFKQADFNAHNANFNNFNNNFSQAPMLDEIQKAKDFFSFTHNPSKEEIKKKYKELARKYHPDINDHDDTLMKELNHHKDILMKTVS